MSAGFTESQRETLARLADILAPAYGKMPAASEIGIAGTMLDTVIGYRPDLRPELAQVLNRAAGHESEPWLRAFLEDEPELFAALGAVVAHGYYINEEVRRLIGYPGQERLPFDPDETPEYAANGMLGRVQARGPIWRDPRKGENA
ncbi:hypothetical protein [Croceicoccus mobilis]|uniref:Gluconate 2-dehydrogenase subunit 3 family protein n=1 Tax=Croceicoccus mobilis TaxID=1703339 RepID=A0A916Z803_9SPHN|nr:hypothetical protein [Croceicoccus mobilis]GGD80435.1 hypothetical protein GCM10010990_32870 [Croceicoccus mobilis]